MGGACCFNSPRAPSLSLADVGQLQHQHCFDEATSLYAATAWHKGQLVGNRSVDKGVLLVGSEVMLVGN